jgi:KDO2-lipid IV(A) lauroyltransferase
LRSGQGSPPLYHVHAFRLGRWLARLLPRALAQTVAPRVARAVYARRPDARAALRANLQLVTGAEGERLDELCNANVANFARMLADYFLCAATGGKSAAGLLEEWRGLEHLETARARGRGVIVVTAHLGNWELGGILLAQRGLALTVITRDEPSTELTLWRDSYRRRLGIKTVAVGPGHDFSFIEMIRALQRNELVAMLVDRPYAGTGAPVEFFAHQSEFSTAPALLWQHTEAAVVPAFVLQTESGRYLSFADPMLPFEHSPDARESILANTQQIAAHFEAIIREHPEQWFNYVPIWNSPSPAPSYSSASP